MPRPKLKLELPEAADIDRRHARERNPWRKNRLLAVKLAVRGEHTAAQIAELCGIARGHLFLWIKKVREQGLEALMERGRGGTRKGTRRGLDPAVDAEFNSKLAAGEFVTAVQAQRWLKEEHGLEHSYGKVWQWLKKAGGVIVRPRPVHSKKDPAAEEEFKGELAQKLEALNVPAGSRVKIWTMDEARFGLHTRMRRVWSLRGKRPVIPRQIKYRWDYLYGSLDVVSGQAHFCQLPSVSLEWDRVYLENLAATDDTAVHVVIRDQAGFHLRDGDARLPDRVRIIDLPPYTPELNPCEQAWDMIRDETGSRTFQTITELRKATLPALQRFWNDAGAVLRLIGRPWLALQANGLQPLQKSY